MTLTIEYVDWDALTPHPMNPRNGDTDAIAESVRVNGVYRPIYVAADGTILAGHHLWHVLGELGHTQVPIVRLPYGPNTVEAVRVLAADNRTADLGYYDSGLLVELLRAIDADTGLIGTGYTQDDLALLATNVANPLPDFTPPDAPPIDHPALTCPVCSYEFPKDGLT